MRPAFALIVCRIVQHGQDVMEQVSPHSHAETVEIAIEQLLICWGGARHRACIPYTVFTEPHRNAQSRPCPSEIEDNRYAKSPVEATIPYVVPCLLRDQPPISLEHVGPVVGHVDDQANRASCFPIEPPDYRTAGSTKR